MAGPFFPWHSPSGHVQTTYGMRIFGFKARQNADNWGFPTGAN
jgi:hypothetical protein